MELLCIVMEFLKISYHCPHSGQSTETSATLLCISCCNDLFSEMQSLNPLVFKSTMFNSFTNTPVHTIMITFCSPTYSMSIHKRHLGFYLVAFFANVYPY